MFTSIRPSIRRLIRRIRTPSRWPWRSINITIIASICASSYITYYQYQRAQLKKEERRFNEGSPLQAIENSLETGDILLFNRSLFPWSSPSSNPPSLLPMRFLLVALQKLIVGSDWDHVAVIVRRNDYPYVLERGCNGKITLLPFESRLLHCSADEIVLRRLHTGLKMSAEQEEEIEQWVETIMGETPLRNNNHSAQNPSPTASSPLSTTAATNLTVAPSSPSPAPRIPPLRLCFHLLSSLILPNRSRRTHTEHERIDQLGHLLGLLAERVLLEERIERSLQALPSSDRSAALNITRAIGSTTPLQRIMIRHKEVTERFTSVLKQFYANTTEGGENNTVDNKLQSMKLNLAASTTPANAASDLSMKELNSTTDFPSTVLVAQLLARRGVLPGRNATAITNNDGVLRLPYANLTANQLPANSSYSPAHFLSSSSIPLLELSTLKSNKNYQSETMSQPSNSSSSLSSLPSASDVHPSSALFDCNLDREMFLKAAHKSLNYTIEK